jgi:hypothetical protein
MRPDGGTTSFSSIEGHRNIDESDSNEGVALRELAKDARGLFAKQGPTEKAPTSQFPTIERHREGPASFREAFDMPAERVQARADVAVGAISEVSR